MKASGVSDATRNRKHCAVTSFHKALNEFELTNVNPSIGVKKSKTEKNRAPVYMNSEQLRQLLVRTEGKYRERNLAILQKEEAVNRLQTFIN
ncbi:hypothetical protein [Paenibacillus popilliae]|uniref:hypothetical protein n=1 Tax=Paenibacillus popilliae TaxID=78057 RepID=UPI00163D17B7|nr:hypothetical protein [Paenibacillus sp. SDF0028]